MSSTGKYLIAIPLCIVGSILATHFMGINGWLGGMMLYACVAIVESMRPQGAQGAKQ